MIRTALAALSRAALLVAALLPSALRAEQPLSGAEFEAFALGKTLFYNSLGTPYGIELYRPDRRVTWAYLDDTCEDGRWDEPEPGLICFSYEMMEGLQCWHFYREGDGLRAIFVNDDGSVTPYTATPATQEMTCFGPEVGV